MGRDAPHDIPSAPRLAEVERNPVARENAVQYCVDTDTYRASFDGDRTSAWQAVISTVAAVSGTDPAALPPLYAAVDPDALERLTASSNRGPTNTDVHVTFTFAGHTVTVHSYGILTVRPPEGERASDRERRRTD